MHRSIFLHFDFHAPAIILVVKVLMNEKCSAPVCLGWLSLVQGKLFPPPPHFVVNRNTVIIQCLVVFMHRLQCLVWQTTIEVFTSYKFVFEWESVTFWHQWNRQDSCRAWGLPGVGPPPPPHYIIKTTVGPRLSGHQLSGYLCYQARILQCVLSIFH